MLKKLTSEQLDRLLDCGIREFGEKGLYRTSMETVAKQAGLSVGVLYKYYENKDALFLACLRRSLQTLVQVLADVTGEEHRPLEYARALIHAAQSYSREHEDAIRMYHQITATDEYAAEYAGEIEQMTASLYTSVIERAQASGALRKDADPRLFAFFLDNLLMMIQFSYSCPYYRERFRLYTGGSEDSDELVADQLLRFLESAFTFEKSAIRHRTEETV